MHAFDPGAVAGKTRGAIDHIDYVDGMPGLVIHPRPAVLPHGAPLLVSGWTVDPVSGGAPQAICILLDGERPLEPHVEDSRTEYGLVLSTSDLPTGPHELRAYALSEDGSWYESAVVAFRLFDHHRTLPESGTLARELEMLLEEPLDATTGLALPPDTPIRANHWILFRGWTFDRTLGRGAEIIMAADEDGRTWSGPATLEDRGFEVIVPAAVFGRGRHHLRLTGLDAAGRRYANSIESTFDVIAAERPFPLTARVAGSAPPFAARLPEFRTSLPAEAPVVLASNGRLVVEGWALDESGVEADEVYLELTASGAGVPPLRYPAHPVDNSRFRATFNVPPHPNAVYELALAVVQPGRCSYSRASLATLHVEG